MHVLLYSSHPFAIQGEHYLKVLVDKIANLGRSLFFLMCFYLALIFIKE